MLLSNSDNDLLLTQENVLLEEERERKNIFTRRTSLFEIARSRQNVRVYGRKKDFPVKRLHHGTSRFSKKVVVSARVCWRGETRIHFIDINTTLTNS